MRGERLAENGGFSGVLWLEVGLPALGRKAGMATVKFSVPAEVKR
jgi:hypothetical protein